jgi:hypothetical protein
MGKKKSGGAAPPPPAKGKKQEAEADEDEGGDPELGGLFEDELDITVQTITFLVAPLARFFLCCLPNLLL